MKLSERMMAVADAWQQQKEYPPDGVGGLRGYSAEVAQLEAENGKQYARGYEDGHKAARQKTEAEEAHLLVVARAAKKCRARPYTWANCTSNHHPLVVTEGTYRRLRAALAAVEDLL